MYLGGCTVSALMGMGWSLVPAALLLSHPPLALSHTRFPTPNPACPRPLRRRDGLMEESRAKVVLAKVTGKILASERAAYQDRSGRGAAAAKAISGQKVAAKLYEMVAQYAKQK